MININHQHTYIGPNIHASKPVIEIAIVMHPDILTAASGKIDLINQYFSRWFSWAPHNSQLSLHDVAEFLAGFARALLNEVSGSISVARVIPDGDGHLVILGYHHEQVSLRAIQLAVEFFLTIEGLDKSQIHELLQKFWSICHKFHPDFQAQFLIDYCEAHDIPYRLFMPETRYWQYGAGNKSTIFFESSPITDNSEWSKNKQFGKEVFKMLGAPVAESTLVESETQLENAVKQVGFPCVVKPLELGLGRGVLTNLRDIESVTGAYRYARKFSDGKIMVERYAEGEIHRLLVIRGKFWKTIRRNRPFVAGNGESTIQSLVSDMNTAIRKKMRPGGTLGPVLMDEDFFAILKAQEMHPQSVPGRGEKIIVKGVATAEQGSHYLDVTELVHPDTKLMGESLAQIFGIEVCGLDFMTEDVSVSCFDAGVFLEINCTPGLRTPERVGVDRNEIGGVILGPKPGRIPLVLVVAPKQQHQEIRNVIPCGSTVGWVCGVQSGVGNTQFPGDEKTAHKCLEKILRNMTVSAAVIVCDIDSVVTYGMPVDKAQTTVLYNDTGIDSKWENVLASHSNTLVHLRKLTELAELLTVNLTTNQE